MRRSVHLPWVLGSAGVCVALAFGFVVDALDASAEPAEGSSIAGVIQDAQGRPIPGVWLEREGHRDRVGGVPTWRSDVDGRFRIDDVPTGPVTLRVTAGERSLAIPPTRRVETKAGATDLVIVLDPGRQIFARIAEYEPGYQTRWARLLWLEPDGSRPVRYAPIRKDGWTRFVALPADREFELWANATPTRLVREGGLRPGEAEQRIEPVKVQDISGTVRVSDRDPSHVSVRAYAYPHFIAERGSVEEDGTFRIRGLPPGTYRVYAGFDSGEVWGVNQELTAGTKNAVFDLR